MDVTLQNFLLKTTWMKNDDAGTVLKSAVNLIRSQALKL
jgi:hypothetical protein